MQTESKDQITVTLLQSMGEDEFVADAARVSTKRDMQGRPFRGLLKYLAREEHETPYEHLVATFLVEGPTFLRDQWVTHRTQSYSRQSLRYTDFGDDEGFWFPTPDRPLENEGSGAHPWFTKPPSDKQYFQTIETMKAAYKWSRDFYTQLLNLGVAGEVARAVLPFGTMTRFYATANLRNWAHFVKLRTAPNAQWEIRVAAKQVDDLLRETYPVAWAELMKDHSASRWAKKLVDKVAKDLARRRGFELDTSPFDEGFGAALRAVIRVAEDEMDEE